MPEGCPTAEQLAVYFRTSESVKPGDALLAHLADCEVCQIKLAEIASQHKWKGDERRRENRLPADGPARIKILNPISSSAPSGHGWILDISPKGMKLRVPKFIATGSVVQVRVNEVFALGTVRYCLPVGAEFHIGIQLFSGLPQTRE